MNVEELKKLKDENNFLMKDISDGFNEVEEYCKIIRSTLILNAYEQSLSDKLDKYHSTLCEKIDKISNHIPTPKEDIKSERGNFILDFMCIIVLLLSFWFIIGPF